MCAAPALIDPGLRPNSHVYHCGDGFAYHCYKVKTHDDPNYRTRFLRCRNRRTGLACRATALIRTSPEGSIFQNNTPHTCRPDHHASGARRMRHEILQECRHRPYVPPRQLLNNVANRYDAHVAARLRVMNLRHSMRRARMGQFPPVPPTLRLFHRMTELPQYQHLLVTSDGTDNLYAGTVGPPGERCSIFISRRMRRFMQTVKMVLADATFAPTPTTPLGSQVLQIVTIANHSVIPLVQVIMERKSYESYRSVLEHLKAIMPRFRPRKIMTDFERANQRAWQDVFPNAIVRGCYFHFVNACNKKVLVLGLKRYLRENRDARSIVRALLAIPLLPQGLIARGFCTLFREAIAKGVAMELLPIFYYFLTTWLLSWRFDTLCVCGQRHRTNNGCEAANKILRTETGPHHPNFWVFLNAIRRYEASAYADSIAFREGRDFGRERKTSAILNDRAIKNFTTYLLAGDISIRTFLHRASTRVLNVFHGNLNIQV